MSNLERKDLIIAFDGISDEARKTVDAFNDLIRNSSDSQYESAKIILEGSFDNGFKLGKMCGKREEQLKSKLFGQIKCYEQDKSYKQALIQGILIGTIGAGLILGTSVIINDIIENKKEKKNKGQQ